jgi:PIN domain
MPRSVVLDTCVLYPPTLRNTLLGCAEVGLFEPLWTPDIVEELRRNLVSGAKLTPERADEIIREMSEGSLIALIDG